MKKTLGKALVTALLAAALYAWPRSAAQAQHEGHGTMPAMPASSAEEMKRSQRRALESLQEKIDKLEEALEKPDLTDKKRAALKKKLDKLYKKKDRLLGSEEARPEPAVASSTLTAHEVYACPMGDYSGPRTKDGECPNCRMSLKKKQEPGK